MSLAAALHAWLALVPAEVLAKDTRLEVIILNGRLQVNEAKVPQMVSPDLKQVNCTILQLAEVLDHYV